MIRVVVVFGFVVGCVLIRMICLFFVILGKVFCIEWKVVLKFSDSILFRFVFEVLVSLFIVKLLIRKMVVWMFFWLVKNLVIVFLFIILRGWMCSFVGLFVADFRWLIWFGCLGCVRVVILYLVFKNFWVIVVFSLFVVLVMMVCFFILLFWNRRWVMFEMFKLFI